MNSVPVLFTIGHSNHPESHFWELLQQHKVQVLADVRSQPYSRYTSHFNRDALQATAPVYGIQYLFVGDRLGGRPLGDDYYDSAGHVLYYRVAEADFFVEGVTRLRNEMARQRVAIMCSEEDPFVCHRHRLVARVVHEQRVPIQHIRGDGSVQTYEEIEPPSQQQLLFGELEVDAWKSLRSVLPKPPPGSSLES